MRNHSWNLKVIIHEIASSSSTFTFMHSLWYSFIAEQKFKLICVCKCKAHANLWLIECFQIFFFKFIVGYVVFVIETYFNINKKSSVYHMDRTRMFNDNWQLLLFDAYYALLSQAFESMLLAKQILVFMIQCHLCNILGVYRRVKVWSFTNTFKRFLLFIQLLVFFYFVHYFFHVYAPNTTRLWL